MPRKSKEDQEGLIFETEEYYLLAAEMINRYLGDKRYFCGGPIPKSHLLSVKSIQTVLRTDLDFGIKYIHDNCIPKLKPDPSYNDPTVPWEVNYMLEMLWELGRLEIPKRFRAGMMLLYFKFCKGHCIPDPPDLDSIKECNETLS